MGDTSVKRKRNGNIELLRMVATFMVIMLHLYGKSGLLVPLSEDGSINAHLVAIFEAICISCINIYVLISGYFLVTAKFKIGRLLELIFETMFYGVLVFAIAVATGLTSWGDMALNDKLKVIFPVHMGVYWYVSVYCIFYCMMPVLAAGVGAIGKKAHLTVIWLMLIYLSIFKSIVPFRPGIEDNGYSIEWFLTLFLIASYMRLYGIKWLDSYKKGLAVFAGATALIYLEYFAIQMVLKYTGKLNFISTVSYHYNHIFVLLAAMGLFATFLHKKEMSVRLSKIVCALSPMTLGIYLFHEHELIRFEWQKWLHVNDLSDYNPVMFILASFGIGLIVYVAGTFTDYIRIQIFKLCKLAVNKTKLADLLKNIDNAVNNGAN
jgi:surface polysaccharide O-acyltransferase-like enzyme